MLARASTKRYSSRVAEIVLAAHVVNHKLSEASTTINFQLQAKRTWNYRLRVVALAHCSTAFQLGGMFPRVALSQLLIIYLQRGQVCN